MRIDLHNHTNASGDCLTTPKEFVFNALKKGIDAIAVTDHSTMAKVREVEKEARGKPITIIPGEEIFCKEGEVIGLFLVEEIPRGKPVVEVLDDIKSQGALSYAPHPFDPLRHGLDNKELLRKVDIIEVYNAKATSSTDMKAWDFCDNEGKIKGAGSDSHTPQEIGRAFVESDYGEIRGPEDLLLALKRGSPNIVRRTSTLEKIVRKARLKIQRFLSPRRE